MGPASIQISICGKLRSRSGLYPLSQDGLKQANSVAEPVLIAFGSARSSVSERGPDGGKCRHAEPISYLEAHPLRFCWFLHFGLECYRPARC